MIKDNEQYNQEVTPTSAFEKELREKLPEFFGGGTDGFDYEKFKSALRSNGVKELKDGYQLNFIGKDYARRQAGELPTSVIVPDEEQNNGEGKYSKNLFFTGDNLEVLRHLQANYTDKIDVIYIDPPYNTGNGDFVYPDNFDYTDSQLKEMFGLDDDEVERMKSIQGSSSHSAWLTFMYPRLALAHKLLSKEGSIFISIDDNEQSNLELLMNEVWGEQSFLGKFVWRRKKKGSFLNRKIRKMSEYILYFDKSENAHANYGEKAYVDKKQPIVKRTNSVSELCFPELSVRTNLEDGTYFPPKEISETSIRFQDPIIVKDGLIINKIKTKAHFIWSQSFLEKEIKTGSQIWLSNKWGINVLRSGQESKFKAPSTILDSNEKIGTNEDATEYIQELFNKVGLFSFSKPVSLIHYLIKMITYDKKNATILDFFAGSSTTADAVMQLNAEDGGNRKFIMVQLPEKTYTTNKDGKEVPTKGGKAAYDAGFRSIDEISRERIRRAADKIKEEKGLTLPENFDGSFKHYRVVKPNTQTLKEIDEFDPNSFDLFNNMLDNFSSEKLNLSGNTSGEETVLTTWLAADGYSFDADIKELKINDYIAHIVENNRLYLIKDGWTAENTKTLINLLGTNQLTIQSIVLFGYSFNIAELRELENALKQLDANVNLIKRY